MAKLSENTCMNYGSIAQILGKKTPGRGGGEN